MKEPNSLLFEGIAKYKPHDQKQIIMRAGKGKIGMNAPCPCGSGKKFKKCHGSLETSPISSHKDFILNDEVKRKLAEVEAHEMQRIQQQGLGRPIISVEFTGYRIIAVGSRVYWSDKWKTFHDFLISYIASVMGNDWGNAEIKKPFDERHPILQWYDQVCRYQRETIKRPGYVHSAPMIGVAAAYLNLAYNLYLLAHNLKIQSRLVKRLKDPHQFYGALYETYVAAAFIQAGFELELENEEETATTHCEFTAKSRSSGGFYSVEAKSRQPGKLHAKVSNQLYSALKKQAKHRRVVFIDVNVPETADDSQSICWLEEALTSLRSREANMTINGQPAPEAYVFATNHPYHYNLEQEDFRKSVLAEGFKIPDFKLGTHFPSIRHALSARNKHSDMFQLLSSLRVHYDIPSTFGGEIPELAFKEHPPRLEIGKKYLVPLSDGKEAVGELTAATVAEHERLAYCAYLLEDGRSIVATCPLSEAELSGYRKHPDTFFGVYRPQGGRIKDPLELFDFCFETYRNTPKEKLLEFLCKHPDFEFLKEQSQNELAIIYCERVVYSLMKSGHAPKDSKPVLPQTGCDSK